MKQKVFAPLKVKWQSTVVLLSTVCTWCVMHCTGHMYMCPVHLPTSFYCLSLLCMQELNITHFMPVTYVRTYVQTCITTEVRVNLVAKLNGVLSGTNSLLTYIRLRTCVHCYCSVWLSFVHPLWISPELYTCVGWCHACPQRQCWLMYSVGWWVVGEPLLSLL